MTPDPVDLGALSLVPALLAICLAFLTRQVLPALFLGIVSASVVLWAHTGDAADLNFISRFLLPSLGTSSYAKILLIYLWCLGGLVGIWERSGGALHFARVVGGRVARDRRGALLFTWVMGLVFHQGGTVSTVLTGATARPVADANRVSHEELSYVIDSTGSPVATIIPFNAWPAYVAALVAGTVPILATEQEGFEFFIQAIPFNFYGWFAVLSTGLFAMGWLPWVGRRMAEARRRALVDGLLDRPGARPLMPTQDPAILPEDTRSRSYQPGLVDFLAPVGVLVGLAVIPYVVARQSWVNEAFMACVLTAIGVSLARGMAVTDVLDGFVEGCKAMTIGAIILGLAVTMGTVAKDLGTATWLVGAVGGALPAVALPALLTALCMGIAFATGTSWGTYAVVYPLAMPLAWALAPDPTYLAVCFGAVLGGAVFGDQCSPISDTTILSSMFSGCDLMDHVQTQLPMALAAAGLAAVASTVAAVVVL